MTVDQDETPDIDDQTLPDTEAPEPPPCGDDGERENKASGSTTPSSEPEAQDGAVPASGDRHRPDPWQWAALALGVLALGLGLFAWLSGGDETAYPLADKRDAALIAAHQHIVTMNTLDYRQVDEGLAAWSAVTTGLLHDQIANVTEDERALLAEQRKVSSGRVVDAAVLDVTDDTATVIAAVEITVEDHIDPDAPTSVKRNRFSADLVLVDGDWLLENLQQVAVNLS